MEDQDGEDTICSPSGQPHRNHVAEAGQKKMCLLLPGWGSVVWERSNLASASSLFQTRPPSPFRSLHLSVNLDVNRALIATQIWSKTRFPIPPKAIIYSLRMSYGSERKMAAMSCWELGFPNMLRCTSCYR